MVPRRGRMAGALLVLSASAALAGAGAYHFPAGTRASYRYAQRSVPPAVTGAAPFTTQLRIELAAEAAGRIGARVTGRSTRPEIRVGVVESRARLEETRLAPGSLGSPDLDHPTRGPFAHVLELLFPPRPEAMPAVGESFSFPGTLRAPRISILGSLRTLPIRTTATYVGSITVAGRRLERLELSTVHREEGDRRLLLEGEALFDARRGRLALFRQVGVLETYKELFFGFARWFPTRIEVEVVDASMAAALGDRLGLLSAEDGAASRAVEGPSSSPARSGEDAAERMALLEELVDLSVP